MIATRRTLCPIIMRLEFACWKQDHHCNNLGLLSLTPVNFDSSMDKWLHQLSSVGWDYLSIPNLQRGAVEVWELISKFIPHFITNVMINQCWTLKLTHISQRGPWWLFSMCTATLVAICHRRFDITDPWGAVTLARCIRLPQLTGFYLSSLEHIITDISMQHTCYNVWHIVWYNLIKMNITSWTREPFVELLLGYFLTIVCIWWSYTSYTIYIYIYTLHQLDTNEWT